jgi:hypothetical protein
VAVREVGHRCTEAETLTRLGDAHYSAGNLDAACDAWSQAVTILSQLDHTAAEEVRARLPTRDLTRTPSAQAHEGAA